MNQTPATAAVCEIELKSGSTCGIQAIGRCITCERAFCLTHQARGYDGFHQLAPYVDLCAPCFAVKQAEDAKRKQEEMAPYTYFMSGAARTDLLNSGISPIDIYDTVEMIWEPKKGWELFADTIGSLIFDDRAHDIITGKKRGYRYVPGPDRLFGRGWILGEFPWTYSVSIGYRESKNVREDWLTALLDMVQDGDYRLNSYYNTTLVRVQPYSGGYQAVFDGTFVGDMAKGYGWREAMQAVKRLKGDIF